MSDNEKALHITHSSFASMEVVQDNLYATIYACMDAGDGYYVLGAPSVKKGGVI